MFHDVICPNRILTGPGAQAGAVQHHSGYLVFPAPYVFPGIGEGLMLVGYSGNFLETTIDAYLVGFSGDAAGLVGSVDEVFVVPELIYFSGWKFNISKYGINSYSSRGWKVKKMISTSSSATSLKWTSLKCPEPFRKTPGSRIAQPDSIRRVPQNPGFERELVK